MDDSDDHDLRARFGEEDTVREATDEGPTNAAADDGKAVGPIAHGGEDAVERMDELDAQAGALPLVPGGRTPDVSFRSCRNDERAIRELGHERESGLRFHGAL